MVEHDFYKLMQIPPYSSIGDVKKRYYELALLYHPDKNPKNKDAEEYFKILTQGYNLLSDSENKKEYDLLLDSYYSKKQNKRRDRDHNIQERIKQNRERKRQNIIADYLEAESTFSHKKRMLLAILLAFTGFMICFNHWYVNLLTLDNLFNVFGYIVCNTGFYFIANIIYRKDAYKNAISIDNGSYEKRAVKTFLGLFLGIPVIFYLIVRISAGLQLNYAYDYAPMDNINKQSDVIYYEFTVDKKKILRSSDLELDIDNTVYAHYRVRYSKLNPNISELEPLD